MHLKKIVPISVAVLSLLSTFPVEGADSKSNKKETVCGQSAKPMRVTVRHIDPKGIGYNQGYSTIDGFFSLYNGWDEWRLFLDTRLHIFNNGEPALNAGLGTRYVAQSRVWGGNIYYDYRKTNHYHYNQITAGLESLGKTWDFRLNGYAPVGRWSSPYYDVGFVRFQGNQALVRQKYEYALGGFNAEAAIHVEPSKNFPLYFAAGPYYLNGRGGSTWGGQGRASVWIYDYLKLEGNVSYDHLFKWIGQGQVSLTFSFGGTKEIKRRAGDCSTALALSKRSYQPVDRFEIIPVDKVNKISPAINPATGEPYFFTFVNNTSSSLGTFESPYPNLATAETNSSPHGVIYVFPGDGTTSGMDAGVTLQDYQRLWGSAVTQMLPSSQGMIAIPAQSSGVSAGATVLPIISNAMGDVVTLANGNEVSGLFLQNVGTTSAISCSGKTNATVLNCTMAGANAEGHRGIYAIDLGGTLLVDNCFFNQNICGMELSNTTTNLQTSILNSNFGGGSASNSSVQWTLSGSSEGNLLAQGNTIVSYYAGISVTSAAPFTGTVNNNDITAGSGAGVYFNTTDSQTILLSGNTITGGAFDVTPYVPCVYFIQSGDLTATLQDNNLYATAYSPALEVDTSGGTSLVTLNNNAIINSYDNYAIYLKHTGGSLTTVGNENTITAVDEPAIYSLISTSAITHTLNLTNNTINGTSGWYIDQTAGTLSSNWDNNLVTGSGYGVNLHSMSTDAVAATFICSNSTLSGEYAMNFSQSVGALSVDLNNNKLFSNDDETAIAFSAAGTSANFTLNNNQMNAYYAIDGSSSGSGNFTLSAEGNTLLGAEAIILSLSNTGNDSIALSNNTITGSFQTVTITQSAGTLQQAQIANNTIIGGYATEPTFVYTSSSTAAGSLTFSENTIIGAGGDAIDLTFGGTGSIQATLSDNTLSAISGYAVNAYTSAAGSPTLILENNTVSTSGGFNLVASAGSSVWNVNGNTFTASGSTPVAASTAGTGAVCMQLNNNIAYPVPDAYVLSGTGSPGITCNTPIGNVGGFSTTGTAVEGSCP